MANETARALRKRQTVAEQKLWKELRTFRRHGYHFRRQVPIEGYIVDFACLSQRLIIEVDGAQHDLPAARSADAARDADLVWRGFKVLRFANWQVSQEVEGVRLEVLGALGAAVKQE
jgi:very-short-patch-repair endonuclease